MQLLSLHNKQDTTTITEGLSDLLFGTALKARSYLSGVPDKVKDNKNIQHLIKQATDSEKSILDDPEWWTYLGQIFRPDNKKFGEVVKKATEKEADVWIGQANKYLEKYEAEKKFQTQYEKTKQRLKQLRTLHKLRDRYMPRTRHKRFERREEKEKMTEGILGNLLGLTLKSGRQKLVQRYVIKNLNTMIANAAIAIASKLFKDY